MQQLKKQQATGNDTGAGVSADPCACADHHAMQSKRAACTNHLIMLSAPASTCSAIDEQKRQVQIPHRTPAGRLPSPSSRPPA